MLEASDRAHQSAAAEQKGVRQLGGIASGEPTLLEPTDKPPAIATAEQHGARELGDLPQAAQTYVRTLEEMSGARISAVGVGPGREQTVQVHDLL